MARLSRMRVLIVDDEPRVVEALERMLDSEAEDVDVRTATSGHDALALLDDGPFDLVVTDMRMPQMDGAELLARVHRRHPEVLRFVLSGQMDRDAAARAAQHAHHFLTKPCPIDALLSSVERARGIRALVVDPAVRALLAGLAGLDADWAAHAERLDRGDLGAVAEHVSADEGLRTKVERLGRLGAPGSTVRDTLGALGPVAVRAVLLEHAVMCAVARTAAVEEHERLAFRCGAGAHGVGATPFGLAEGLVSHLGSAIIAVVRPAAAREAARRAASGEDLSAVERELLGASHSDVAAGLLAVIGLPAEVIEAVAHHEDPSGAPSESRGASAALHVACAVAHGRPPSVPALARAGWAAHAAEWEARARPAVGAAG